MRVRTLLLALLVASAGCLGSNPAQDDPEDDEQPRQPPASTQRVERTFVFEGDVEAGTESRPVGPNGTKILGSGLVSLDLELTWNTSTNDFQAKAHGPQGSTTTTPPSPASSQASASVEEASSGLWRFEVVAEGPHAPDQVRLEVTAAWELPSDVAGEGALSGEPIETERRGDEWLAWRSGQFEGEVGEEVGVSANASNGRLNLSTGEVSPQREDSSGSSSSQPTVGGEDQALVRVEVWARGDTEQQARERVRSVNVSVTITPSRIEVQPWVRNWQHRGVDVDVAVPEDRTTTPELEVSNGEVNVRSAQVQGAELATTNGVVRASMDVAGEILFETTNGEIQADLAPQGQTHLLAETVNGDIELGLEENSDVGYRIEAETTNGRVSESMDEATFEGSNQEGVLRTENLEQRSIRVNGTVETVNAAIAFQGR